MRLSEIRTSAPDSWDEEKIKDEIKDLKDKIEDHQKMLQTSTKHSVLIVLQGMDCSGKDGAVRGAFSGVTPSGIEVYSFKKPTDEEFAHDYLWRVHEQCPKKGMIKVFNRSHYEDILVPSVYGYIQKEEIEKRFEQINSFEKHLEANGTKIIKFYLHLDKDEQLERLTERTKVQRKYYKHNDGDWETREHWGDFMEVYEKIFEKCNDIPWNIVGSDQNWYKVFQICKIVEKELSDLKMDWPPLRSERFN